ncbi:MAG: ATP-binding protein [Pseudomonadota bacterium]
MPFSDIPPLYREALGGLAEHVADSVLLVDFPAGDVRYCNPSARSFARRIGPATDPMPCAWLIAQLPPEVTAEATSEHGWHGCLWVSTGSSQTAIEVTLRRVLPGESNGVVPVLVVIRDTSTDLVRARELQSRHVELRQAYEQLALAQQSMLQNEKMASAGRLAAGVAHEINNPIGYVHANIGTLRDYLNDLVNLVSEYDRMLRLMAGNSAAMNEIDQLRQNYDIDYTLRDLPQLLSESVEGIERVRKIVQDLKDFSHPTRNETWSFTDIHRILDSTLNIASSEIKYKAKVKKDYGTVPEVQCIPQELSQVFLNILVNAAQSITGQGLITIATGLTGDEAWVSISDNGPGIPSGHLSQIFEPFFTTKPIGAGTGLGLWISYQITNKHHGRIEVFTAPGQGTTFRIVLPVRQP